MNKELLILDADDTLWGGNAPCGVKDVIIDEVWQIWQKELLELKNKGVKLAICSMNEIVSIINIFDNHPNMVLTLDDFYVIKANWNAKSKNIFNIYLETKIPLNKMVFIDDADYNIKDVKKNLPEVICLRIQNPLDIIDKVKGLFDGKI